MLKLKDQIEADFKQAMKNKEADKLSVLRMLTSAIKNKEIAQRKGKDVKLTDEQVGDVLRSEIKKRQDATLAYKQGERQDLAEKEKEEITIIEKYLPKQLDDEEIKQIVKEIVDSMGEISIKDFGKVMGQAMSKVKGKADGNKVSEAVKEILAK